MTGKASSSKHRESGQAAVESAITLPLVVFLVLGTLQLFLALQARIMAQYAAYRAVRAGSVNHGDCRAMTHAAIAALLPTFQRTDTAARLGSAFSNYRNNKYGQREIDTGVPKTVNFNGDIVWIFRTNPQAGSVPVPEDQNFDQGRLMRLEVRLVLWYAMRVPFANWVMNKMFRAHFGVAAYNYANPLLLVQKRAGWTASGVSLDAQIASEYMTRSANEYVLPISATSSMRMMTPAQSQYFTTQNCPPAP